MKTIIFDFDGTIADTFSMSVEIAHSLTGSAGQLSKDALNKLRTKSTVEIAEELKVPKYMWPFLLFRGRRQMSKRLEEIRMFSGMDEVLDSLHGNGCRLFVMSSNSSSNISKFLKMHEIKKDFRKVYGGVGLLNKAGALRKVLKRNKLNPSDVIYVGDEVRDIEASRDVDIQVVAVSWGFNDVSILEVEKPTVVVHTRPELLKALNTWISS